MKLTRMCTIMVEVVGVVEEMMIVEVEVANAGTLLTRIILSAQSGEESGHQQEHQRNSAVLRPCFEQSEYCSYCW